MKKVWIIPAICLFLVVGLIGSITDPKVHELTDNKGSLICGVGFFYNTEEGLPGDDTVQAMEELASGVCKEKLFNKRTQTPKPVFSAPCRPGNCGINNSSIWIDNVLIVNWELEEEDHLKTVRAYRNASEAFQEVLAVNPYPDLG